MGRHKRAAMPEFDTFFDRTGAVRRPGYRRLLNEAWSLLAHHPSRPSPEDLPKGRDHGVLVVPAFLTPDGATQPLRRFLQRCGYRTFGWTLGLNWGPTPHIRAGLRERLSSVRRATGERVSVIGVSLGGLLARDLACDRPDDICRVITIGSPLRLPTASTIEPLFRLAVPFYDHRIDVHRLRQHLAMPSTTIFTRDDGIVAWESCRAEDSNASEIEVSGAHLTICRNPDVLRAVAEILGADRESRACHVN